VIGKNDENGLQSKSDKGVCMQKMRGVSYRYMEEGNSKTEYSNCKFI
jgi:hypothetical protein